MKPLLILIALVAIFSTARAQQTDTVKNNIADTAIVVNPATPPEFPGGKPKLYNALARIVRYPAKAKENNIQGKVILNFVIEKDGSITNIQVKQSVSPELDNEIIRAVKLLPKFDPGKNQTGEPVRAVYELPFNYSIQWD